MRIKALVCISGVDFVVNAREETDRFDDAEAIRFIEAGFAVPVVAPVERAVARPAVEKRKK